MFNLGESDFRGEVCHSESLVFAEGLRAGSAFPDVNRAHDVAVVNEVDDSEIDYVVLV